MSKSEEFLKKLYQLCEEYEAGFTAYRVYENYVDIQLGIGSEYYDWSTRDIDTLSIGKYLNKIKSE